MRNATLCPFFSMMPSLRVHGTTVGGRRGLCGGKVNGGGDGTDTFKSKVGK